MDPVRPPRRFVPILALLAGGALGALTAGCGSSDTLNGTGQAYISGTVRLNGTPVAGATVASGTANVATTSSSGAYTLAVIPNSTVAVAAAYTRGGVKTVTPNSTVAVAAAYPGGVNYSAARVVNSGASGSTVTQNLVLAVTEGGGGGGGGSTPR